MTTALCLPVLSLRELAELTRQRNASVRELAAKRLAAALPLGGATGVAGLVPPVEPQGR